MTNTNARANAKSAGIPQSESVSPNLSHSPSVPISLYREVASELQTAQSSLQALQAQNQELSQKNQRLQVEIERVVQSALHLRQIADPFWGQPVNSIAQSTPELPSNQSSLLAASADADQVLTEQLLTEQPIPPARPTRSAPSAEINTAWLIVIICLIVVTAFGTGFLIVRPLLPSR